MVDYFLGLEEPKGMRALAQNLGLRYVEGKLDRQFLIDVPAALPGLPLFNSGDARSISEMSYGSFGGLGCQVFTFDAHGYIEDPTNQVRTCVLFTLPANFATLTFGPHSRLSRVQERTATPFTSRFRVLARDSDISSLLLDEPMQRFLMGMDDALRVELSGNALLGHAPQMDPDLIPLLLQQIYGIYLRIPDGAWARYGTGDDLTVTP